MTQRRANADSLPSGFERLANFPLLSALLGRRSRRFPLGGTIPDGPFAYESASKPHPLSEMETAILVTGMTGNTGWHNAIPFNSRYAPKLPNYAGAAGGRVFPSAAGFHTSDLFFTNDSGVFHLSTRDANAQKESGIDDTFNYDDWLQRHRQYIKKISDRRLVIPREEPYVDGHNLWIANAPGSLLAIPVVNVAQHVILGLCYLVQNGYGLTDDIHREPIPGMDRFGDLIDLNALYPLSYFEQVMLGECTVEVATSCYAGALLLQAMGLGGWMYDGIDRHTILGVPNDSKAPGLGFVSQTDSRWATPNPVGLPGIFEAHCPPFFKSMDEAVDAVIQRKFGQGGPFHPDTPGPWKDSKRVRGSAVRLDPRAIELIKTMARHIFERFGKFPATLPSIYCLMYLQAHHIDLEFYDRYYSEGAYLETHASHVRDWHARDWAT